MTTDNSSVNLILLKEAGAFTNNISDERVRAFVKYGLTTVLIRRSMDPTVAPQADFDLRFFVEALRAIGSNRDKLLCILTGDPSDMDWWPEDDPPI